MPRKAPIVPKIYPLNPKPGQRTFCRIWKDGRSQDVSLGPAGSPEAIAKYAEVCAQLTSAGVVIDRERSNTMTVAELADWYSGWCSRNYRANSREPKNIETVLTPFVRAYGPTAAVKFTPRRFKEFRVMLAANWSRRVINRYANRIRTMFRRAAEDEILPGSIDANLRSVKAVAPNTPGFRERPPRQAAAAGDVAKVMPLLPPVPAAMLRLQWLTGMRPGEVRVLRTQDLEQRAADLWIYRPHQHKTLWLGQPRDVRLGPEAIAVLSPWLLPEQPGAFVFTPERSEIMAGRPWSVRAAALVAGAPYTDSGYGKAVRKARRRAGVAMLQPYQTRHAAKLRFMKEGGIPAAMALLGQKSSNAFDDYASEGDVDGAADLARRIG